ncbi:MAG: hypothetical protein JSV91_01940, partial [Phycisphaerales bacterium]
MMICFAALATWALLSVLNDERWAKWLLYAAMCALGIWSHMMMVWVPIGHAVWLTWRLLRSGRLHSLTAGNPPAEPGAGGRADRSADRMFALRGLAAIALAAALTILLYWPVLDDILRIRSEFTSAEGDEPSVFGIEGLHTLLLMGGAWYWWATLPGLIAAGIGLFTSIRSAKPQAAGGAAVCAALLGLPIMVIALWAAGSWMYARFALFALPGAVLLMAIGIDALWKWRQWIGAAGLAVIVICAGLDLGLRPSRQPLREAAAFVRDRSGGDDGVLIVGLRHRVMDVYASDLDPQYSLLHGQDLETRLDTFRPRWVIVMYPRNMRQDRYEAMRQRGYSPIKRFDGWVDWGNGGLEVWEWQAW